MTNDILNRAVSLGAEADIIARVRDGETQLFHDLIRPYERIVYGVMLRMLHNKADAEDAAQEAFLRAFRYLGSFRFEAKFSTWLVGIAVNEARSRLRRNKVMHSFFLDCFFTLSTPRAGMELIDPRLSPAKELERKQLSGLLVRAIEELPTTYRDVFLLRSVQEYSTAETAHILGINPGLVKVRMHRARYILKKAWPAMERSSLLASSV